MKQRVELKDLRAAIGSPVSVFIGTSSFESRCLSILTELLPACSRFLLFPNKQSGVLAKRNLEKIFDLVKTNGHTVDLDLDSPTKTADAFHDAMPLVQDAPLGPVFVDITTFTHEHLLILLRVLFDARLNRRIIFGYTGAEQYSVNTSAGDAWLSKGVSQIRTVLGFPGKALPSRKLHLIVLVGFEYDRAKVVIEKFEPSLLTLGIGAPTQSVSSTHYETNQRFFEQVKRFVDEKTSIYSQVKTFEFSGIDPISTRNSVLEQVNHSTDHNVVVCPMNTKLSTLGAGLAALQNKEIQLVYSRAITYNEDGYSTPSSQITLFEFDFTKGQFPEVSLPS